MRKILDSILCFVLLIVVYFMIPFAFIGILIWEWKNLKKIDLEIPDNEKIFP